MTRQRQIHEIANTIDPNVGKEWIDKDYNCADVYDFTIGFECGAKWADENPNLYSDEKYQTIKVSQLDELNRKAKLYDEVADNLHEFVKECREYYEELVKYEKFIAEHVTKMYKGMEE